MSIRVEQIEKRFGNHRALDRVSLDVASGELLALLGPSGCGKTTLLRVIAGLEAADSGRVFFDEQDHSDAHVRERQVGFVFQHYALFRHMTVFDNVAFGLRIKPRRERLPEARIREKVRHLLALVQLEWLADRYPAQLSGGQRQRIALARALAVEPRVLLLDEPFGALDAKVRKELRQWLRHLHDELHITSILVTHDQDETMEVADRIVLMHEGRIEQSGAPDDVYQQPATSFAYHFLGAANVLPGRIEQRVFRVGDLRFPLAPQLAVAESAPATAYVRPHDFAIVAGDQAVVAGLPASITRVVPLGAQVRIELSGTLDGRAISYEVQQTRSEAQAAHWRAGDRVQLQPRTVRLYPQSPLPAQTLLPDTISHWTSP